MRKIMTALTALSLVAAPTTAAYAQSNRGDDMSEEHRTQLGHGVAYAIIGLAVLFVLILVLDDDDDESTSP